MAKLLLFVLCISALACRTDPDTDALRRFSSRKVGSSPDVGLYVGGGHIATVHGMTDDLKLCEDLALHLNDKHPGRPYVCIPLNE